MRVTLRHPGTGDIRFAETGWSWSLFLASAFLGLPLFFRGLALWGTVMVVAWSLSLATLFVETPGAGAETLDWLFTVAVAGLCLFFGARGNALAAKRYFALGYDFARPDSPEAREAARSWGL